MAGPQVQHSHSQRPNSAYYMGLNGGGGGGGGGVSGHHVVGGAAHTHTTTATSMSTSSSAHTGLHALRHMSNDMELIYRGNSANASHQAAQSALSSHVIQQQPTVVASGTIMAGSSSGALAGVDSGGQIAGIANVGQGASDALIVPSNAALKRNNLASSKTAQRSVEIVVDASQCGTDADGDGDGVDGDGTDGKSGDDVEQGRRVSRHRRRPLHRRFFNYLRNLFQGNAAQNDSELEEFETPARYRPDSLSALSRTTRFTEDEIKRIYRGFKAECPTGVVKEDTFKLIYSQFFPQGANPTLYAHYVFNTLDQDHSGIVSFEDFVQGLSILSRGSVEEKLRWTFSLYDINGDGFITREEMTDIVTAIYELMGRLPDECPEEEKIKCKVEHIFQKMDKNRDGVVTLDEFLETCRNDEAISRSMSVFDSAF
uniref:Kv channel-interacting protein 4 n=1 Tax=Ceratitis capitata TaxID=7213 RepID=W8B2T4_CERCA